MANNTLGTEIKGSTCPEEQTRHKNSPNISRGQTQRWRLARFCPCHAQRLLEDPDERDGWGSPGVLERVEGGNVEQGHGEGIQTHLCHFPEEWLCQLEPIGAQAGLGSLTSLSWGQKDTKQSWDRNFLGPAQTSL